MSAIDPFLPDADPLAAFNALLEEARQVGEAQPEAMALATVSSEGLPSLRIVLFKGWREGALCFYTNLESRKGRELAANPRAALVFYWPLLRRQVRFEGPVERLERTVAEAYFHSRPRASQLSAAVSAQSEPIASMEELAGRLTQLEKQLDGTEVPLPDFWGGFGLRPQCMEFWAGAENRLHERMRFHQENGAWRQERLAP